MSQNDFVIANQAFPATRADLTSAFQAAASNSSGALAPTTTYSNMMWYDTTAKILKIRSEADDAWISIGYLDQSSNTFKILDDTVVTTAAGADTNGIIGDQTTGTWETGTGTTESLVSPAKVLAAINANVEGITHTSGTAPYYGVRAWGYFASNVLVDGGNFASWNSTTNTVSFTTAMPHANYAVSLDADVNGGAVYSSSHTTAGFVITQRTTGGNAADPSTVRFMVIC